MLPRKVFSVKPGLCSKLKTETRSPSPPGSVQRSPEIFHEQYCDNTRKGNRSSMEDLSIPEPVKASRPINIEELFPDREKMDTSYVEVLRKLDTPIIVITEDSEGDRDVVEEFDSDAEIVELEKERGVSVQRDVIEEEAEHEITKDQECLEGNQTELEETNQTIEVEETEEGATENEESIQEPVKDKPNEIASVDPVLEDEKTDKEEGQEKAEVVTESSEQIQDHPQEDESVDQKQREIQIEKTEDKKIEDKVPAKIDRELIEKLVSLHGGWQDAELKKNIKQTPKGWQLISV